ncbi:thiol-activated cytolysin family protein [Chryseobacterium sp. PMSZPI]|uniref:thiol-activated cytolysin family protein n=1 Tax=Chryseobacterium sp. PMSZPI TaxID=1033900 RepID=UPI0039A02A27
MKKVFQLCLALGLLGATVISCRQDDEAKSNTTEQVVIGSKINPIVKISAEKLGYDDVFISDRTYQIEQKSKRKRLSQFSRAASVQTSDEMVVTVPSKTFLGAVYDSKSLEDLKYKAISYPLKPIVVSYSFPSSFVVDTIKKPSLSGMRASLLKALKADEFSGQQSLKFDYNMRQFTSYTELKLAFGANVNVGSLLNIDASASGSKITKKTGLFAKFSQKYFTIDMDMPDNGNIFAKESDLNLASSNNPIYISSITYGRLGVISIESDANYDEVSAALKASLQAKKVNGSINIDSSYKNTLEKSQISVYILGGKGSDVVQVIKGFDAFADFIVNGGEFTAESPGVPIQFSASHASDNSVYYTTFTIDK